MNSLILFVTADNWVPTHWIMRQGGGESEGRCCLDTSSGWIAITRLNDTFEDCDPEEIARIRRLIKDPVSYLVEWNNEDILDRLIREIPANCNAVIDNDHGLICSIHMLKNLPLDRWLRSAEIG